MQKPAAPAPLAEDSVFGTCDPAKLFSDPTDMVAIAAELRQSEQKRDAIFKQTKEIQQLASSALLQLHRGAVERANELATEALGHVTKLLPTVALGERGLVGNSVELVVKELKVVERPA